MKMMLYAATAIAVLVVLFFLVGPQRIWQLAAGDPDLGPVDFKSLKKTEKPNQALVCSPGFCSETADITPPTYLVPASELRLALNEVLKNQPNLTRVADDPLAMTQRYVSYSPWMRFPDTTRIQFIALGDNKSTIAMFAQAQLGYSDFESNKQRLEHWLGLLDSLPKE